MFVNFATTSRFNDDHEKLFEKKTREIHGTKPIFLRKGILSFPVGTALAMNHGSLPMIQVWRRSLNPIIT